MSLLLLSPLPSSSPSSLSSSSSFSSSSSSTSPSTSCFSFPSSSFVPAAIKSKGASTFAAAIVAASNSSQPLCAKPPLSNSPIYGLPSSINQSIDHTSIHPFFHSAQPSHQQIINSPFMSINQSITQVNNTQPLNQPNRHPAQPSHQLVINSPFMSINQSINQSTQPLNQPNKHPDNMSVNHTNSRSILQSISHSGMEERNIPNQSINQSINYPVHQSNHQQFNQYFSLNQPTNHH